MLTKELISIIEIPQYIREVQLSKAQRPKYLEFEGMNPTVWNIPFKYLKKSNSVISKRPDWLALKEKYIIAAFRKNTYHFSLTSGHDFLSLGNEDKFFMCEIVDLKPTRVIINSKKVGTPRFIRINAQDFYAGFASPHMRGKVINEIKHNMLPYLRDLPVIDSASYPIRIELEIVDCVKNYTDRATEGAGTRWDLDNRAYPYFKSFLDLLVTGTIGETRYFEPKLIDDDRLHVTGSGGALFTPVENFEDRMLRFHIYKDLRPIILTNKYCQHVKANYGYVIPEEQPW